MQPYAYEAQVLRNHLLSQRYANIERTARDIEVLRSSYPTLQLRTETHTPENATGSGK